jgi:hypothetical protein
VSNEDMMRAGMARRNSQCCPAGGGRSNGGRVAKAAYANGGDVSAPLGGSWGAPKAPMQRDDAGQDATQAAQKPRGLFSGGGRVKGGC